MRVMESLSWSLRFQARVHRAMDPWAKLPSQDSSAMVQPHLLSSPSPEFLG